MTTDSQHDNGDSSEQWIAPGDPDFRGICWVNHSILLGLYLISQREWDSFISLAYWPPLKEEITLMSSKPFSRASIRRLHLNMLCRGDGFTIRLVSLAVCGPSYLNEQGDEACFLRAIIQSAEISLFNMMIPLFQ